MHTYRCVANRGHIPIDMKKQKTVRLVFPGYKGMLGPQGTEVLLVEGKFHLSPNHHGTTGLFSSSPNQPKSWPEFLESGTPNTPRKAGLCAALIEYEKRKKEIVPRETILANSLYKRLDTIFELLEVKQWFYMVRWSMEFV